MTFASNASREEQTSQKPRDRRRLRIAILAIPLLAFVFTGLFGPILIPYDPLRVLLRDRLLPPGGARIDGTVAWFGTDDVGRDILAQVVHGARISLMVAVLTIGIAAGIGSWLGLSAGYRGGWRDTLIMRIADVQLALPSIVFAILIAGALGPSVINLVLALAMTRWVIFARVARGTALSTREQAFVDSARMLGAPPRRILRSHILPSALNPLLVVATLQFGLVIVAEASLSFLGVGTPPQTPSWGVIIANGRDHLESGWWIVTFPGLALGLTVISAGLVGDQLSDRFDPRQQAIE